MEYHHAVGLGPLHVFDEEKDIWIKKSIFTGIYGKTLTLFYLWKGYIYYGGLYKVINMRAWNPEGASLRPKSAVSTCLSESPTNIKGTYVSLFLFSKSPWALADTTIQNRVNLSTTPARCWVKDVIAKMYQDEVLNVEHLGLQCVGFDHQVYKSLRSFFEVSERMQSVKRARVGQQPETTQGGKRQRVH